MADCEDQLEIDDAEILQILEETLYKAPVATAIEQSSPHVAAAPAASCSRTGETASILRKVRKPCVSGLFTPGVRDGDQAGSCDVLQCSLIKTPRGVGVQRKVTSRLPKGSRLQSEVAQESQKNRQYRSPQAVEYFSNYEAGPGSAGEGELPPLRNKFQVVEPPLRPKLSAILPYTIPGPGGVVQRSLNSGKNAPFREFSIGRRKGETIVPQDGEFDEEDSRFTEEPWLRAVVALKLHEGESATIGIIRSRDFEGHVSKFIAVIVCLTQDGFGGAFVTLEDPTGRINGTIHKSVFEEPKYTNSVKSGAIVLLQNVAIFRPDSRARLMSILAGNIIQVFRETPGEEPFRNPSQAGAKRKEAPTDYCGTMQTYEAALAQGSLEVQGAPNLSSRDRVSEGKERTGGAKSNKSQCLANVALHVGRDLEEGVDLDCSLEDLYN